MYLLDANVVSELRRRKPHGGVLAWIDGIPDDALYISALTLAEIQTGIELTREQDATKAADIEAWLNQIETTFNVLPMDGAVFRAWAKLMHQTSDTLYEDAMLAATAKVHKLTVVTRNVADFKTLGVPLFNPFNVKQRL